MKSVIFGIQISFISLIIFFLPSCKDSIENVNNQRINNMSVEDIRKRALLAFEQIRSFEIELGECETPDARQNLCDKIKNWLNTSTLNLDCLARYGYASMKNEETHRLASLLSAEERRNFDERELNELNKQSKHFFTSMKNHEELFKVMQHIWKKLDQFILPECVDEDKLTLDDLKKINTPVNSLSLLEQIRIRNKLNGKIKKFISNNSSLNQESGDGLSSDNPLILCVSDNNFVDYVKISSITLNNYVREVLECGISSDVYSLHQDIEGGFQVVYILVRLKDGKKFLLFTQTKVIKGNL